MTGPTTTRPTPPRRADLLTPLVGHRVELVLTNGTTWRGALTEVGMYELTLRRDDGRTAVMHKGAVVAVLPVTRG